MSRFWATPEPNRQNGCLVGLRIQGNFVVIAEWALASRSRLSKALNGEHWLCWPEQLVEGTLVVVRITMLRASLAFAKSELWHNMGRLRYRRSHS